MSPISRFRHASGAAATARRSMAVFGAILLCTAVANAGWATPGEAQNATGDARGAVVSAGEPTPPIDGEWDGAIATGGGRSIRLAFHIVTDANGAHATVDLPDVGHSVVSSVTRDADHVLFEIKAQPAGVYDARLAGDGQNLIGVLTTVDGRFPLTLKRLPTGSPSPWPMAATAAGPLAPLPANWHVPSDAEIRQLLVERIDTEHQGVGSVVGIVDAHGRRIVTYGRSDAANGRPLDGDTEFEIGSITKVFTSLVLANMVDKGAVKLADPISKFLPPGVTAPTRDGKPITLVDLATHTSGLPRDPTNLLHGDPANPYVGYTADRLWTFLSHYQPTREPGAVFAYSNVGVGLLGELLARRAETDYATLVHARVLAPLGMTHTGVLLSRADQARLAAGHDSFLRPTPHMQLGVLAGAGALYSTANDMMTFLAAEMGLRDTPLRKAMAQTLAVRRPIDPQSDQALGWEVLHTSAGDIVWHNGGSWGYRTYAAFNLETRVGVVVLTNAGTLAGADDIGLHILTGAPVATLAPPPSPLPR